MPLAHIWRRMVRSWFVQGTDMTCFMLAGMAGLHAVSADVSGAAMRMQGVIED